jgi:hypothetical protein
MKRPRLAPRALHHAARDTASGAVDRIVTAVTGALTGEAYREA